MPVEIFFAAYLAWGWIIGWVQWGRHLKDEKASAECLVVQIKDAYESIYAMEGVLARVRSALVELDGCEANDRPYANDNDDIVVWQIDNDELLQEIERFLPPSIVQNMHGEVS